TAVMAAGAAILILSRPYEGGALCAGVGVASLLWIWRARPELRSAALARFVAPMIVMLAAVAAGTMFYFERVTGNPFQMPQLLQRSQYAIVPMFLWESPKPAVEWRHQAMRDFYEKWEIAEVTPDLESIPGLAWNAAKKTVAVWLLFLGPALT